ncbi:MAG: invasion associated locus B family protein [Fusobacteriaceae bacterium]
MKKLLVFLMFVFSIVSFSQWQKIQLVDEFGDYSGDFAMVKSVDGFQGMRLSKDESGKVGLDILMGVEAEVGEIYPMKVKIDKGEVIEFDVIAITDNLLRLDVNEKFLDKFKNGTTASFVIYNINGGVVNLKTSLNGFTRAFDQVKISNYQEAKDDESFIEYVVLEKTHFHNLPSGATARKAYLVKGDTFTVSKYENGYGYTEFLKTKGWVFLDSKIKIK